MAAPLLTTIDNPFNPYTNWDEWFAFDLQKGYNTCGYLSKIANVSPEMSDEETNESIERAIDEIIEINSGFYTLASVPETT